MITVKVTGGLGNQLFQYAAATALATRWKTGIQLDVSTLALDGRKLRLDAFQIEPAVAILGPSDQRAKTRIGRAVSTRRNRALGRLDEMRPWYRRRVATQPHFHFAEEFLQLGPNVVLDGYWQSPRYFEAVEQSVRKQFRLLDVFDQPTGWDALTDDPTSVAVHVRRGDYVTNPIYAAKYRVLSPEYYEIATGILRDRLGSLKLLLFSDDLPWCRENLSHLDGIQFIDGGSDLADFRLMTRCSHHILSNSTFAWWAAYLAATPRQQVLAPREWFYNDYDLKDLFPENWSLIG